MFSIVVRRTHMYLALFLTPWVLMYTLSTMAMNHREHLRAWYGEGPPKFVIESERAYAPAFPEKTTAREKAGRILHDVGLEGAYGVGRPGPDGSLTINRNDPIHPKRVRYNPSDQRVVIERMEFQMPAFLERMHRRRGYQSGYIADNVWAFLVDFFIVAMIGWAASGLWMWWEMKRTRRMGALFAGIGLALFIVFLVTI